jgi:glycolate oxidase FAD binding subunit
MNPSPALGLDTARAVDPARFRLGGTAPRAALRPATRGEVAEAVRAAARDGLAIVPWGGGVALAHEPAPARYDVALDLSALDRVIEYEAEDMTLTAECGASIAALRRLLAARGQEAPLEGALAERATLGGVLASNASGPRRLRFGSPRDRILGARVVLADGTIARTGGKVVKNVAGYALHRLLCGSRGGLAVMIEASLKLVPAPACRAALVFGATAAEIADHDRWAPIPRLEPAVLTVVGRAAAAALGLPPMPGDFTVIVGLEDDAPWLDRQVSATAQALGAAAARLDGETAEALWQKLADLEEQDGPRLSFATAHNTPAGLAPLSGHAAAARLVFHAPAGRLHVFPEARDAQALAGLLAEKEFALIESRGIESLEPPIAPQAAVHQLRSRIRAALDPEHRLALGGRWERGEP